MPPPLWQTLLCSILCSFTLENPVCCLSFPKLSGSSSGSMGGGGLVAWFGSSGCRVSCYCYCCHSYLLLLPFVLLFLCWFLCCLLVVWLMLAVCLFCLILVQVVIFSHALAFSGLLSCLLFVCVCVCFFVGGGFCWCLLWMCGSVSVHLCWVFTSAFLVRFQSKKSQFSSPLLCVAKKSEQQPTREWNNTQRQETPTTRPQNPNSAYPRHQNDYVQLLLVSGLNFLKITITTTFSRNVTVAGKTLWLQWHLGIPRGMNFAKIALTITFFLSVRNLNCNQFGADSAPTPPSSPISGRSHKYKRNPNPHVQGRNANKRKSGKMRPNSLQKREDRHFSAVFLFMLWPFFFVGVDSPT